MTDTPTEARSNSERMLAKGDRLAYDAPDDAKTAPPPVDWAHRAARGIICDLCDRKAIKWGFENVDEEIRAEIVGAMSDIIRAASPPAPAAEAVAYRWRYLYSDGRAYGWAYQAAPLNIPAEGDACSELETPAIISEPLYTHPLDAAAIRAEARREAFEEAAAWHDEKAEIARVDAERFRGGSNPYTQRMMIVARHKEAARAIRALADKGEADGWRPIETAPKDGTRVLLAVPGQGRAVIGMWDQAQPAFQKPAAWEFFLDEAREFGGSVSCAPTHWRPLPAPPAGGRDGE